VFEGGVSGGMDAFIGGNGSYYGQVVWNWRTGEFAIVYEVSLDARAGTPRLLSGGGGFGIGLSYGSSSLRQTYLGASEYEGMDISADAIAYGGLYLTNATAVTRYDADGDGIADTSKPTVDEKTGMQVTTITVGAQAGVNALPNGVDASLKQGLSVSYATWYCAPTGFLSWSCQ
jgi:hypothetical protein